MWLDATNEKTDGGALDGQRIRGVARQQASFYSEYRVAGLPLTQSAGARYETQIACKGVTLRFNIDNLADKAYWAMRAGRGTMMQGAPRTAKLSAQLHF